MGVVFFKGLVLSVGGLAAFALDAIGVSRHSLFARPFPAEGCLSLVDDSDVILCSVLVRGLGSDDN